MNDNPYNAPKTLEITSVSAKEPVVKNNFLHIFIKVSATLLLGSILAAFNIFGGFLLAVFCAHSIAPELGYLPDFGTRDLVGLMLGLLWLSVFVIAPFFALTICWKALSDEKPLSWCKRNWWLFLIAFAFPFAPTLYLALAGALAA